MEKTEKISSDVPWTLATAFVALMAAAVRFWVPIQDPDQGWLRWAGEQILSGHYPSSNAASWTVPNEPWILHETLPAVLYGAVPYEALGVVRGILLVTLAGCALGLAARKNSMASTLGLALWVFTAYFALSERAMAFGLLLLAVEMLILERSTHPFRYLLAAMVVAFWASVHGSFVIGILVLALYSPAYAGLAAIGACLNPHGPELYSFVLMYVRGDGVVGDLGKGIEEWRPLDFTSPDQLVTFLAVLLMVLGTLWGRRENRAENIRAWTFSILAIALTLRSERHAPLAGTILLPLFVDAITPYLPTRQLGDVRWLYGLGSALMLITSPFIPFKPMGVTPQVVQAIPEGSLVWNDFGLGGWLMEKGVRVFWDGRNDCYPPKVFDDGLMIESATKNTAALLREYHVNVVVTQKSPLRNMLLSEGWSEKANTNGVSVLTASNL